MGFDIFEALFAVAFVFIIGSFIVAAATNVRTWNNNNHSPRLTVSVVVVAKRMDVSHHMHPNAGDISGAHGYHTTSSTQYYVTFQVASGDRMELSVSGREYGLMAEGDEGELSFQGTRFLSFEGRR